MEWLTAPFVFLMMILTFVGILGRYLFNAPIYVASEMIQFLLAASVFSTMGIVWARDGLIVVELFTPHVSGCRFRRRQLRLS
jgi:TRAP-type C4-dicarboxylate transport system permease small subunit